MKKGQKYEITDLNLQIINSIRVESLIDNFTLK